MTRTLGRALLEHPISGEEIERLSFERIEREGVRGTMAPEEWIVARRLIHTSGDPGLVRALRFVPGWQDAARNALRDREPVYCDASMARSGISRTRLLRATGGEPSIHCEVASPDVARRAAESGLPRSVWAVRKAAAAIGSGGIWLFGNAPTGLMELVRLHMEDGFRPSLVVAMPVGFVHVVESKEEFLGVGLPGIVLAGRRGGSPLVVACVHALCALLEDAS
ncbi:MAG: precorrin-8X methylmutase [Fibrobacteres bacterium]|nr:precorrin-8X methylmutase [Fibrobacterota bacterium]QQS03439.1 MAG: precorrin-8X methylmutase [Fibrobacterota bacterium]